MMIPANDRAIAVAIAAPPPANRRRELVRVGRMGQLDRAQLIGQVALIAALPGDAGVEIGVAAQYQREGGAGRNLDRAGKGEIAGRLEDKAKALAGDLDLKTALQ